jgi:1-aminocyclopropane-1-carboxylate deaminase/D-cysteine desulfhydrase-like pyridoxal-dependent ACC family enzyme
VDLRNWLSPVQLRDGRWYKREDLCTLPAGVNGSKLRACDHLIRQGASAGRTRVISAASVLSPQNAMAAVLAARYGMRCMVILGGTTPKTAFKHRSPALAREHGAEFEFISIGYNPMLQRRAEALTALDPQAYWLQYGITTAPSASARELRAFHQISADQVANLPEQVTTLVVPFGSGNTAAGVLMGLNQARPPGLERVVLVAIGPDRRAWLADRFERMGVSVPRHRVIDLHGSGYAKYTDAMPGTADGITLHPTYEGKVVRYLDAKAPDWWVRRDGTTCLWIVGGPLK